MGKIQGMEMLAVVGEIVREFPRYGPQTATATVILFDEKDGETRVQVPVSSAVEKLKVGVRYHLKIELREMADGEQFTPNIED